MDVVSNDQSISVYRECRDDHPAGGEERCRLPYYSMGTNYIKKGSRMVRIL